MDDSNKIGEALFDKTQKYINTSLDLLKLKAVDKAALVLSSIVSHAIVVAFVLIFFFVLNVGVALWLGEILSKSYYGFLAVAGFYGIVLIFLFIFKNKWIKAPIRNAVIKQVINDLYE